MLGKHSSDIYCLEIITITWVMIDLYRVISCPVASVLYSKGREQGTEKRDEREEGLRARKNLNFLLIFTLGFTQTI